VLETLRRTRSGHFTVDAAVPFSQLVGSDRAAVLARVLPIDELLPDIPALSLSEEQAQRVRHGMDVAIPEGWAGLPPLVRLVDDRARLVALAVPAKREGFLHPSAVLG
jgi:tRNA pseudouridine55 synthase